MSNIEVMITKLRDMKGSTQDEGRQRNPQTEGTEGATRVTRRTCNLQQQEYNHDEFNRHYESMTLPLYPKTHSKMAGVSKPK
jgi:hypothetical protein